MSSALLAIATRPVTASAPLLLSTGLNRFLSQKMAASSDFYSFTPNDLLGKPFPFEALKGKVVLIVNVASK